MRRELLTMLLAWAAPAWAAPATYTLDPQHSFVHWEVVHFGTSTIRGRFGPARGTVTLDAEAGGGVAAIEVSTASVSTGYPLFDTHLRAGDLLDAEVYPTAWFVARSLRWRDGALHGLEGELSWRGISGKLVLEAIRYRCYPHPRLKREVCGGDFEGELKRSGFDLFYGLPFVADRVKIRVQVEGIRNE